tara:strand:+ start:118 stop:330 length:213 start_codon:yes stop_codon:yes gene_type:complete
MDLKENKNLKVILYISAWVIIWGSIGSLIDYPLYKANIYNEGSLWQYLTFTITGIISFFIGFKIYQKLKL